MRTRHPVHRLQRCVPDLRGQVHHRRSMPTGRRLRLQAAGGRNRSPAAAAEVQRFLSIAAGPVAYGPAAARLVTVFGASLDHPRLIETAHTILSKLDQHLEGRKWLASDHPTIADIANYSYIAHAPEGDVSLAAYPNVRAWLKRIETLPGFVPMQATAVGLAA